MIILIQPINNNGIKNIVIIGATNKPWKLNDKILNLFEKKIYVPLLKENERKRVFEINFEKYKLDKNANFDEMDRQTEGFTGADIYSICQDSMCESIKRKLKEDKDFLEKKSSKNIDLIITKEDINKAIKNGIKSIREKDLDEFKNFKKNMEISKTIYFYIIEKLCLCFKFYILIKILIYINNF